MASPTAVMSTSEMAIAGPASTAGAGCSLIASRYPAAPSSSSSRKSSSRIETFNFMLRKTWPRNRLRTARCAAVASPGWLPGVLGRGCPHALRCLPCAAPPRSRATTSDLDLRQPSAPRGTRAPVAGSRWLRRAEAPALAVADAQPFDQARGEREQLDASRSRSPWVGRPRRHAFASKSGFTSVERPRRRIHPESFTADPP